MPAKRRRGYRQGTSQTRLYEVRSEADRRLVGNLRQLQAGEWHKYSKNILKINTIYVYVY